MNAAMPMSLSTACLTPMSLPTVARIAATAGFDGLELVLGVDYLRRGEGWVRRVLCGAPVPVRSVHQPLYPVGRWRQPGRLIADTVKVALQLHAQVVVLHSPWSANWREPYACAWLVALEQAQEHLADRDVTITVENVGAHHSGRPMPTVLGTLDSLAAFCRTHGLGLTYDTCHAGTLGAELAADLWAVRDVLANVHLSDYRPNAPLQRLPVLDMLAANHQLPGEGALALRDALQALTAQGYGGPITFEVSPFALRAYWPPQRRVRLARALAFVREATASAMMPAPSTPALVPAE